MKTMSDVESWLYACEEDPAPPPPSPIPPSSPKWETPKAHLKRQKKRNQREEKAAQRAKAALRSKITVKLPKQNSNLNGDMMEKEDLCHACPIFAPHRTGVYAYGSPELPKKILIIQAKIAKAKATEDDIKLHNAFAAVHANFALGQPHPVPESANAGDDGLGIQTSDLKKPQQGSQCQHPECPVKASHRSGNTSRPNKIKNVTAKITKGTATEDDFQLLAGYFAVHSPGEDDEGGATSPESVEIIC
ncbi:MAG: hypothetical protein HETSPECPRED_004022 [Heterodermia speciosa]|uniref:Uncharacterized protein n=1 Tax=Heterodermia speciosa TaxID=116794 RepID=A0A8H3FCI3_9LECA|nr:MAG: hypothetical protein HETSPECPRED_004022 [Heterodermia speciosa]